MAFVDLGGILPHVDANFEAWQVTLDRLELDVMRAERAFASEGILRTDPWDLPSHQGPIPDDLRDRAGDIRARQDALLEQIAAKLGYTQRQQAVTDCLSRTSTRTPNASVYVDVSA
jgi:hypothetical protein